jgi:hypothetical protein
MLRGSTPCPLSSIWNIWQASFCFVMNIILGEFFKDDLKLLVRSHSSRESFTGAQILRYSGGLGRSASMLHPSRLRHGRWLPDVVSSLFVLSLRSGLINRSRTVRLQGSHTLCGDGEIPPRSDGCRVDLHATCMQVDPQSGAVSP